MVSALLADRAKQEPGEAAVPSRSNDQEVCLGGRVYERFGWIRLDHLRLDGNARLLADGFG